MASRNQLQFPVSNSPQRAGNTGRSKVALKPGRSLMDWIRLTHAEKDLSGVGNKLLDVTADELSKHNKRDNAWICLKGKVYNITPYMEYHPGGEDELMRGAGRDATDLFNQVHKWVNAESMLQKCLVGRMKMSSLWLQRVASLSGKLPGPETNSQQKIDKSNEGDVLLNSKLPTVVDRRIPKYDWFQSETTVSLVIYSKWKDIRKEHILVDLVSKDLLITLHIEKFIYRIHLELESALLQNYEVKIGSNSGAVEILFRKESSEGLWKNLGKPLTDHNLFVESKEAEHSYRPFQLLSKTAITHDTYLFTFAQPSGTRMIVPLGYHICAKATINDVEIVRSYTPVLPSLDFSNDLKTEGNSIYLMIKIYPNGTFTPYLNELEIGNHLSISDYDGDFEEGKLQDSSNIVLLAAGTGFTPMVKLIHVMTMDYNKRSAVKLLFFNKTKEDILWKENLDKLSEDNTRFQVKYILSEPQEDWLEGKGRISVELLEKYIPPEAPDLKLLICICGPTPFTKTALGLLGEMGYNPESIHAFMG